MEAARHDTTGVSTRLGWILGAAFAAVLVGYCGWLVVTDAPAYQFLVRLYVDKHFLRHTLREWGMAAPALFVALQTFQVILAPIPGEITGILGGYLFGEWPGLLYSTVGTTLGSAGAFTIGRRFGSGYVRKRVSREMWNRMAFIVEAEGAVLCFMIYLLPGLPKDMVSYLFGLSPMSLWAFAIVSTLGRIPGAWVLSAQGAHTAAGDYLQVIYLAVIVVAVAVPLYCYRSRVVGWFARRSVLSAGRRT